MITKKISKPETQSNDSVFQAIENHLSARYKLTRQSGSKIKIERLYKFQSDGWEVIMKKLNLKDSGYFKISDNHISLTSTFTQSLIFWTLMSLFGFFILWKLFHVSLFVSFIIIVTPSIIGWAIGLYNLKKFLNHELNMIKKRLNH